MEKGKNLTSYYFKIVALLSLAIAISIHFELIISYFQGGSDYHHGQKINFTLPHIAIDFSITYIVALLMFTLNFFILTPFRHQKISQLTVFLSVMVTLLAVTMLNNLLFMLKNTCDPDSLHFGHKGEFFLRNFFVSGLVVSGVLIIRLIYQQQSYRVENEQLRSEAIQSQYESLKNQLSPHFLFNSLTALQALIQEAPDKAEIYVSSLSKALRYTLQRKENQLVRLEEELKFMDAYLYLIRMRFEANLKVDLQIPELCLKFSIPPLTIQTLVENAIKHNEISKRNPLSIRIEASEKGELTVWNSLHKKISSQESTGIGLKNLSKQIQLLMGKDIIIHQGDNHFEVIIPLIRSTV